MSGISKHKIIYDTSDVPNSDTIGSFLKAGTDGEAIDSTSNALHVLLQNASVVVSATDLDIRDLAYTQDSVTAHQGGSWTVAVSGTVAVSATDLDIRDLSHSQDSVKIGDGTDFLAIASDGSIAVTMGAYDTVANDAITVGTSEVEIVAASPVANRRYVLVQNVSDKPIYVGATGVTTADGVEIPKGGNVPFECSGGLYAICGTAGKEIRILELGYGS